MTRSEATRQAPEVKHVKMNLKTAEFLLDLWLPAIRATIRPSTYQGYAAIVSNHVVPSVGDLALEDISAQHLNALYARLLSSGRLFNKTPLSPASVIRVHAVLRRAFRDAVRWGYMGDNPASNADPPKQRMGGSHLQTWTSEELRRFLAAASADEHHLLWVLLAMTGMRRGEVLGLRWQDLDLENGLVLVRQTVIAIGGKVEFSTPKTAHGRRIVALDPVTLHTFRKTCGYDQRDPDDLIFCDSIGQPLFGPTVTKQFNRIVAAAGLPRIRLHDLRHTHATLALQLGIHPKIVSERLGHSTVAFTLDIYSHATPHMQAEAALQIGGLISDARIS